MLAVSDIKQSKILIAALDWGFGHTARTSVLIKKLQLLENEIVFAGNETQIKFIKQEHPDVDIKHLPGYNIQLDSRKNTYFQLLRQVFKVKKAIKFESNWLKTIVENNKFDYILSDNRYGFHHPSVHNILLTHQTALQIPKGRWLANTVIKSLINNFSTCWIPDYENHLLSGKLSTGRIKIPTVYIGPLSRFKLPQSETYKFDYLFMISGPEPECYQFLKKSLSLISKHKLDAAIATPFKIRTEETGSFEGFFEQLDTKALEKLINDSKVIVSRSGYTTIMDLVPEKKPMLLFPSIGQYEQIYLSSLHGSKNEKNKFSDIIKQAFL